MVRESGRALPLVNVGVGAKDRPTEKGCVRCVRSYCVYVYLHVPELKRLLPNLERSSDSQGPGPCAGVPLWLALTLADSPMGSLDAAL
ncbi:uncharacterized protein PG986_009140 [Apiospora aurea]|uniref:Uncharacterized protein n=1 Tax=Apiospora aurea TaxID=335848 RepID=A0ABR1Q764_9PEZI